MDIGLTLDEVYNDLKRWQRSYRRNMGNDADCEMTILLDDLKNAIMHVDVQTIIEQKREIRKLASDRNTALDDRKVAEEDAAHWFHTAQVHEDTIRDMKAKIKELETNALCPEVW